MKTKERTQKAASPVPEKPAGVHAHSLQAEEAAVVAGEVVGAAVGTIGGPPGMVAGMVVGGLAGAVVGKGIELDEERKRARREYLDETIGVIGGDIGLPAPAEPGKADGSKS